MTRAGAEVDSFSCFPTNLLQRILASGTHLESRLAGIMRVGQGEVERPGNVQESRDLHDTKIPFTAYWLMQFC